MQLKKYIKDKLICFWFKITPTSQPQVIFILSHMRSGSSLLEHILTTNNKILGFGEQNRIYHSLFDIKKMELYVRCKQKKLLKNPKYIVDQILHNSLTPNIKLLNNGRIKIIFLIRSPLETISSIERLGGFPYGIDLTGTYNSGNYYTNRMNTLMSISKSIPKSSQIFLTYNDLINDSDSALNNLSMFLELKYPLQKKYKLKPSTRVLGDRSENILKGEIVSMEKKTIPIDSRSLEKLDNVYNMVINFLNLKYDKTHIK